MHLLPGIPVSARGLSWEVVAIEPAGEQQRLRLRCTEGAMRGQEWDFLVPFEQVTPIASEFAPERAGRLQAWRLYHEAFLLEQALGPNALLATQPGRLDLSPYQLVPLMRALRMSRPRLLLADGVGLGKTIQAGLILAELIARRRAHRILVVSPAGPLLRQWYDEMRLRFGLRFQILDRDSLQEIRYGHELGANPFDHVALGLISLDFAKQERVLVDLERTTYDIVVIDEAHHCVRLGAAGDREDSQRRTLAETLARRSDGLLLLTATPHDGFDSSFASLMELLDPSLVDGRGALRGETYRRHVVRRLKQHIRDPRTGECLFKMRAVHPRAVPFAPESHPAFARFQETLLALVAPKIRRAIRKRRYAEVLAFVSLLKRSVSTVAACRATLETIAERYAQLARRGGDSQEAARQRLRTLRDYRRRLDRYGTLSQEEEADRAALEAEDMAADLLVTGAEDLLARLAEHERQTRRTRGQIRQLEDTRDALLALIDMAGRAETEDPKLEALVAEIIAIRKVEPRTNVLVYTEYADSLQAAASRLARAVAAREITGEILTISGRTAFGDEDGEAEDTRTRITARFSTEDDLILVSTDASAEGLNLHARCHQLIHLELPYNPNRLEQRNGRIDRYGQTRDPQVRYLYLTGTFEERLLLRLVAKYERQSARLTFVPNTLGVWAREDSPSLVKLLEGLSQEDAALFKRPPRELEFSNELPDDTGSAAYNEMMAEVERVIGGFDRAMKAHAWLGEAGEAADDRYLAEADQARLEGNRAGGGDLLDFVMRAIEADTGKSDGIRELAEGVWQIALPPTWDFGLEGVPGYDARRRTMLLTGDPDRLVGPGGEALGFLGRAHPLVRRALDRVMSAQFGGGALLDRRVSAASAEGDEPALLCTFVGAVASREGKEFGRVLGVRVGPDLAATVLYDQASWTALAAPARAVPTQGAWERHFASWAATGREAALRAARAAFEKLAVDFAAGHRSHIDREAKGLDAWFEARVHDLCGAVRMAGLFDEGSEMPRWKTALPPRERLAAFAGDPANHPARREEAKVTLGLYESRKAALDRRAALRPPEVVPLGLLLLVPRG